VQAAWDRNFESKYKVMINSIARNSAVQDAASCKEKKPEKYFGFFYGADRRSYSVLKG